jgi:hypothetical protein
MHTTMDNRLPFPTKPLVINGVKIEEYVIPEDKKRKVLEAMYPFIPLPEMDEVRLDIHSGKLFKVRQFRVTREFNQNWLVSPYYEEGGGTVIDWVPPDDEDCDEEDELEDQE